MLNALPAWTSIITTTNTTANPSNPRLHNATLSGHASLSSLRYYRIIYEMKLNS